MKFIFLVLPLYLYSGNLVDVMYQRNAIKAERNHILADKNSIRKAEYELSKTKIEKVQLKAANDNAQKANELYYEKLKERDKADNNTRNIETTDTTNTNKGLLAAAYKPSDFNGKPQLKLENLHILGISSIKPFKDNKLIIEAANGTFALPREKFNEAQKINFTQELVQ
ncbi:MAG: hypothetical protein PHQ93_05805 [Sulfurimonas sp.]|uniref:hypothetical protein n=1 Tax=Sulfurimonas sp. TaxID=2022749 RepID=UPI0026220529|nr:hypothetical protein [Sulfurimonas sp.]MDD5400679.1 hypothetical protein [Sulfurimonas sp.]